MEEVMHQGLTQRRNIPKEDMERGKNNIVIIIIIILKNYYLFNINVFNNIKYCIITFI